MGWAELAQRAERLLALVEWAGVDAAERDDGGAPGLEVLRLAPSCRCLSAVPSLPAGSVSRRSGRDERGHEGAGPGLERLGYALSKDRVQRGAEQPGACIGVRFPHV